MNRWFWHILFLTGCFLLFGPLIYWLIFVTTSGDAVILRSDEGIIHVLCGNGLPVRKWPITIDTRYIENCSVSSEPRNALILFFEDNNKYYLVGSSWLPLPVNFEWALKHFLKEAKEGHKASIILRPPILPEKRIGLCGVVLLLFGLCGSIMTGLKGRWHVGNDGKNV